MYKSHLLNKLKSDYFWLLVAFIPIGVFLCFMLITIGRFNLDGQYQFSTVFYNMWKHLISLSLEIDKDLIGFEAFNINGKITAYFLPFPAIVRGLQSIIHLGESSTLSILIACFVYLISIANLYVFFIRQSQIKTKAGIFLSKTILVAIILASPILPTLTLPTIYVEAVIWGYSLFFACISLSYIILANNNSSIERLPLCSFALVCGLALFIRAPYSLASAALFYSTIMLLSYKLQNNLSKNWPKPKLLISIFIFTLFLIGLGIFNYLKWGSPFEFYALKYYVSGNFTGNPFTEEEYQQLMQYGVLHPSRILHNLSYYFLPHADNFLREIPFFTIGGSNIFSGIGNPINYKEPSYSIPLMLPVYFLLFLFGLCITLKKLTKDGIITLNSALIPSVIAASIPPLIILCHHANSLRYSGEFIPIITLFALYSIGLLVEIIDTNLERVQNLNLFKKSIKFIFYFSIVVLLSTVSFFYGVTGAFKQDYMLRKFEIYYPVTPVKLNQNYIFGRNSSELNGNEFLGKGWSEPENDLIWSSDQMANLRIPTPYYLRKATIQIIADALITPNHPKQTIDILINGNFYQSIELNSWSNNEIEIRDIFIHSHHRSWLERITNSYTDPGFINIEFKFNDAVSPKQLKLGEDGRILALGIKKLEIKSTKDYKNYPDDHFIKGQWIIK